MTEQSNDGSGLQDRTVGVLGGTGAQGRGLAYRFAAAGLPVIVGSRDAERAIGTADELNRLLPLAATSVRGEENPDAARHADIAIAAIPFTGHADFLTGLAGELAGTIVVDCVCPIAGDDHGLYPLEVPEGSAAQQAALALPDSTVVAAFHNLSSVLLFDVGVTTIDSDVLVLGEDREVVDVVIGLAGMIPGARGVYGGRLRNARQIEALTANLIAVNRRYKTNASIRITGI